MRTITLAVTCAFFAGALYASVGPTDLASLVDHADRIVVGTAIEIIEIDSTKIAKVHVERYITKAEKHDTIFVLAQPTWQCDISGARVGERCLWFLEDMTSRLTRKERKAFSQDRPYNRIEYHGRGRMPFRTVDGRDYVTLWTDDVILPDTIATIAGPPDPDVDFDKIDRSIDSLNRRLGIIIPDSIHRETRTKGFDFIRSAPYDDLVRAIEGFLRQQKNK